MTKPTREQKYKLLQDAVGIIGSDAWGVCMFISRHIAPDYAPLSAERRAELEARRRYLSRKSEQYTQADAVFYQTWLAEIDAELEGDDG